MEFHLHDSITLLERTPGVLLVWLRDLPQAWTHATEGPETWSPFDVVGHLIHGERTDWVPRLCIILEQGEARPFDPYDRFAQFGASQGKSMADLLNEFASLRAANVAELRGLTLSEADLERCGTHPEFGRVTLRQLLATWTAHDLNHLVQIARVMARQYQQAVGPWQAYLGVMQQAEQGQP